MKGLGGSRRHGWPMPGVRWVAGKEHRPRLFPVNDSVRGRCPSPERDAEELEDQTDEDSAGLFSETEGVVRRIKLHWGENHQDRKYQRFRALRLGTSLQKNASYDPEYSSTSEKPRQTSLTGRVFQHKSFVSQVPLKLQIKVSGQRGCLGISIAGGKGSLPYRPNDEGIFISRVSTGGPAERAGVHVGDRVLEVNGQNMQEVGHHEAVGILRNAGSCIKMKVVRERASPPEVHAHQESDLPETETSSDRQRDVTEESRPRPPVPNRDPPLDRCVGKTSEAIVVCNGNGLANQTPDIGQNLKEMEASLKNNALQVLKTTMTIPRIILTHPSTSDEDVEPLTQGQENEEYEGCDDPEGHLQSDCLNSAFYPP